ncbi:MAG: VC0807 family protein [Pseudomonadota bacterium]
MDKRPTQSPNKVWLNMILDIALPVIILNKLSPYLGESGPFYALLLAVSLPLGHGLFDFYKERKINWISLLGLMNVLLTGGFALMKLEGIWFAIKEASFPALIGIFVFFSSFSKKPLFSFFLNQPGLFAMDLIENKLQENNARKDFEELIKKCTLFFSATFFLSAFMNFYLALRIFKKIPADLNDNQKAELLNSQIADMTWMGYVVIALPLMVITTSLFYYCLRNLSKITQLSLNELLNAPPAQQ